MKKTFALFFMLLLVSALIPTTAFAGPIDVVITAPWTTNTLEAAVALTPGAPIASEIGSLTILCDANVTPTPTLLLADIAYINTLSALTILDVSENITVGDAGNNFFDGHTTIESVTFPAVTFGAEALSYCGNLKTVNLPAATTFGDNAFDHCVKLDTVSLPIAETFGAEAFAYCGILASIDLPNATTFGDWAFDKCLLLDTVSLPNAETFGAEAFAYCDNLQTVNLPAAKKFGYYAFDECPSLKTVNLPSAVEFGYQAFYLCVSLETVNLPVAVEFGHTAFYHCDSLVDISLPAAVTFDNYAFSYCGSLATVSLPNAVTFGTHAFYNLDKLVDVSLPTAVTFGNYAFKDCDILASIDLPMAETFGYYSFYDCNLLASIDLPAATTFGSYVFGHCNLLASIDLPSAVTFGDAVLSNCINLVSINLPKAETIGNQAFNSCANLVSVNLPSAKTIRWGTFTNTPHPITMILGTLPPNKYGNPSATYMEAMVVIAGEPTVWVPESVSVEYDEADGIPDDGMWCGWLIETYITPFIAAGTENPTTISIGYSSGSVNVPLTDIFDYDLVLLDPVLPAATLLYEVAVDNSPTYDEISGSTYTFLNDVGVLGSTTLHFRAFDGIGYSYGDDIYNVTINVIDEIDPVIDTNLTSRNVSSSRLRFYATADDEYQLESFTVYCGNKEYFSEDGNYEVRLSSGRNDINLTATDSVGNSVHYNYNVNYHASSPSVYIPPVVTPVDPIIELPIDPPVDPPVVVAPEHLLSLTVGHGALVVDGLATPMGVLPFIENDSTLVPVRFITEALGAEVNWNKELQQVQVLYEGREIVLTIDSTTVLVDGVPQELLSPARLVNDRAFVPLRFISETLGADVDYDDDTKQIAIRF